MDGTTFRTPDSPENRAFFGAQGHATGKAASEPQVRCVSLPALPIRLIADMAFGESDTNEMRYAEELIARIPDHSLRVFDEGFFPAAIRVGLTAADQNRHFLIPAKAHTKWEVPSRTPVEAIVQMKASPQAQAKPPRTARDLGGPRHPDGAAGWAGAHPADLPDGLPEFEASDIAACYLRRWEVETSYRELEQTMLGGLLTLRSQDPTGIMQGIWGALIANNLVRLEMAKARWRRKRIPPT